MSYTELFIEKILACSAIFSALITFSIFAFLIIFGLPLFSGGHFFAILTGPWAPYHGQYGIFPMVAGSLIISSLTICCAFPLSFGCAMLISVVDRSLLSRLLRKGVETMTGIPTVIYGFVGIFFLVPLVRESSGIGSGMCVFTAVALMTLLVSPTMILLFCDSFERVPPSYGLAILGVGGTEIQKFLYVTLPHSWPGIVAATTLGLGRAVGDTLIALMVAGNAVQVPDSLFDSARTLTSHIALVFAADTESMEFKAIFACGLLLYLFTTTLVLAVRMIIPKRRIGVR